MDIKNFLSGQKPQEEHYWTLVIEEGWIQAGVWSIEEQQTKVVSISPPTPWETEEELISAADTALSAAVQLLPEDAPEPSKTVFGVPPSWVSEGQIKEEYLEKIKKICTDLSLEPTGFVVLPEAFAHLIKSEEGAPLNAVVIGVGKENIEIAVFRLGTLVGTSSVARSVSVADDVNEGLARFASNEPLPSRFLIYDGKEGELEEARQSLLDVHWQENEKVKFLHAPKIEIIESERKVLATSLAGASEIANVATVTEPEKKQKEPVDEETENIKTPEEEVKPEDLGFLIDKDIASVEPEKEVAPQSHVETGKPPPAGAISAPASPTLFTNLRNKLFSILKGISFKTPSSMQQGKKVLILGGTILVVLFVGGFAYWWLAPKAVVTVYVSPQKLEEEAEVVLDPNRDSLDLASGVASASQASAEVSGEKTKSTTGTKVVGEKAKGSVKIQNGTPSTINLTTSTILYSSGDLRFNLVSTASVAAQASPGNPGTATIEVEAVDIGAQYNLGKDESFKVGNYLKAEVDAIAVSDFSGGSSRDISAVSVEDQEILEEDLADELVEKAKEQLAQNLSDDEVLVIETMSYVTENRSFSNKPGDEASSLKLSLTLTVSGLVVKKDDLNNLARETLKDKVPAGYSLRDEQLSTKFSFSDENDGVYTLDTTFTANLLPEIKLDEIAKNISGKYLNLAENYLQSVPGFTRVQFKINPSFPGRLKVIPRVLSHIEVELAAER